MKSVPGLSILVPILLGLLGCAASMPSQGTVQPGTYEMNADMDTGGYSRESLVHVPVEYGSKTQWPLLVVLHGAFSTGQEVAMDTGFNELADREGFLVLYPQGIGILGFLQHWNAGHCCGKAADDDIDDLGFLDAAIEQVMQRFCVDKDRIFLVGHSNGGMLAFRYAALRPQRLAGIAVVSGAINSKLTDQAVFPPLPAPRLAVPVCIIHGTADDYIPFAQDSKSGRHEDRDFAAVAESTTYWAAANGCRDFPVDTLLQNGNVRKREWQNCSSRAPVVLYAIENWGHVWPGRNQMAPVAAKSHGFDFDAAETIWAFFSRLSP